MDKKKLMLLLGAMVIAIGTALAARSILSGSAAPSVQAAMPFVQTKGPRVLVAQRILPVGTIITADAVQYQAWPKEMVRDAYFIDGAVNMNKLIGTVVRYPITAGQPLTQGALVAPGDRGFLAAALGPGMRAITVPVSDKSDVAGFIFPGDHVDLMLTQKVTGVGSEQPLAATETVLRNLRVLATDQMTETETTNGKTVVHSAHSVTIEATPRIAEKIEVAQTIGTLSLTLRSIADNQAELDRAIASGSIKLPEGATKADTDKLMNAMAKQPIEGASTFQTGGDVSRFARRTMPSMAPPAGVATKPAFAGIGAGTIHGSDNGVSVTRGRDTVITSGTLNGTAASLGNAGNAVAGALPVGGF